MLPSKTRLLTIIGNIGSGKSSVLPILKDLLTADTLDADSLFQTNDPFRNLYLKNTPRWAFTNELWLTNKRADLLNAKLKSVHKPWLIIDSGVLMSWAYTYSHLKVGNITKSEWQLYDSLLPKMIGSFFTATTVVRLEYSIPTLLKRIKTRGRAFEILHYQPRYLSQIDQGLKALESRLKKFQVPLIKITEAEIPDFVNNQNDQKTLISLFRRSLLAL